MVSRRVTGPEDASHTFVFAHGAGAGMDSPFMTAVAEGLAAHAIRVVRFEFPYMAARREGKKNGAPDRQPVLLDSWREIVRQERGRGGRLFIGGKSLGGRMATLVADELAVDGVVCFGYPFHPPGKPSQLRTRHLESMKTPTLILQGERDPFGTAPEVASYPMAAVIKMCWLPDGDHSYKPRVRSGITEADNIRIAIDEAASFLLS